MDPSVKNKESLMMIKRINKTTFHMVAQVAMRGSGYENNHVTQTLVYIKKDVCKVTFALGVCRSWRKQELKRNRFLGLS